MQEEASKCEPSPHSPEQGTQQHPHTINGSQHAVHPTPMPVTPEATVTLPKPTALDSQAVPFWEGEVVEKEAHARRGID